MKRRSLLPSIAGLAILILFAPVPRPASCAPGDDELVSLARSGKRPVIAEFGLGLCRQCKAQSAILDGVRAAYKDKVIVRTVRVNKEPELTARYKVETIPCLVFLDPSGKIVLRKTGVMRSEEIAAQLSRMGVAP